MSPRNDKRQRRTKQRMYGAGFVCLALLVFILIPEEGFAATLIGIWGAYCILTKRIWVK